MKPYNLHGIAGLAERTKHPDTERTMSVYVAEQAGIDAEDPWVTVCETHGSMVSSRTRAQASESMGNQEWCEQCAEVLEETMKPNARKQLWKYNRVTGIWSPQRSVTDETAEQWLRVFRSDEPDEFFTVSTRKPSGKPWSFERKTHAPNHSAGYPVWASPAERQVIDFFRTVSSASAADALRAVPGAKRRDVDRLHAQRVLVSAPSSGRANLMRLAEHKPNHSAVYYVWLLDYRNVPIDSEGPYGPMSLDRASAFARIGAKEGDHDRAVSEGLDPEAESFEIVRRYRRGTGERMF